MQLPISVNRVMDGSRIEIGELKSWTDQGWTVNQIAVIGDQSALVILDPPPDKPSTDQNQ